MIRKIIAAGGIMALFAAPKTAAANLVLMPGDTIAYRYTPLPATDTLPQTPRRGFGHRFVDYFARANQDRTFEKKIDFTFAGGPGYSKNTSLSLSLIHI